jgi:adenylate cyclase
MSILAELRRRNVFRVALAYLASAWFLVQVVETLFPIFDLPTSLVRLVVVLLIIGFPLALVVSWLYELTPDGVKRDRSEAGDRVHGARSGRHLDRAICRPGAISSTCLTDWRRSCSIC